MAKPGIISLTQESAHFVLGNMGSLVNQLKIIFPLTLLTNLATIYAAHYKIDYLSLAMLVPIVYLYTCFALSWHKTSLIGPEEAHTVNPFAFPRGNISFLVLYGSFILIVAALLMGIDALGYYARQSGDKNVELIGGIGSFVLLGIALVPLTIFSFKLPAKSLNVDLTLKETRQVSRGLVSKVIFSMVIVIVVALLVIALYAFIVGLVVGIVTKGEEPATITALFSQFFLGIPVQVISMLITAISITILSKAYQWGAQNNAHAPV
jgi:hypothetical protein